MSSTSSPEAWIWWVVAGLVLGGLLLWHAARAMVRTLPDDVRADLRGAVRRHPRVAATSGVVLAWTSVFALYSLSLAPVLEPARASEQEAAAKPRPQPAALPTGTTTAGIGPIPSFDGGGAPTVAPAAPPAPVPSVEPPPPDAEPGPAPITCDTDSLAAAVEEVQRTAELLTGQPVGADLSLIIDAAGGCADPTTAVLAMLGPVARLVNLLPLPDTIDLPPTPEVDVPRIPELLAMPLRPYVFQTCAEVSRQLVTVTVVAAVVHIDTEDLATMFETLDDICGAFAPAPTGAPS
jgi:hypothetical protein